MVSSVTLLGVLLLCHGDTCPAARALAAKQRGGSQREELGVSNHKFYVSERGLFFRRPTCRYFLRAFRLGVLQDINIFIDDIKQRTRDNKLNLERDFLKCLDGDVMRCVVFNLKEEA